MNTTLNKAQTHTSTSTRARTHTHTRLLDASAEGLFSIIDAAFKAASISQALLASFASDGASVMTGSEHGVAVRLRTAFNMFMLLCHCIAHRQALACADAADSNESGTCVYICRFMCVRMYASARICTCVRACACASVKVTCSVKVNAMRCSSFVLFFPRVVNS